MSYRAFMTLYAVTSFGFGLGMFAAPAPLAQLYGMGDGPGIVLLARLLGAALFSLSATAWWARRVEAGPIRRAVVLALLMGEAPGLLAALMGQAQGASNLLGWTTVGVYALFTGGLSYWALVGGARPDASAAASPASR